MTAESSARTSIKGAFGDLVPRGKSYGEGVDQSPVGLGCGCGV